MKITFCYDHMGYGKSVKREVVEFDDDATDDEINEIFNEWAWEKMGDHFWIEREDGKMLEEIK